MIFMLFMRTYFQEYVLPNINDSDYLIPFKKSYGAWKSFYIRFERINGIWSLKSDPDNYYIIHHKIKTDSVTLNGGEIVTIKTSGGDVIKGISVNNVFEFSTFKKYDIFRKKEITIGAGENNTVRYSFMNLISQKHCVIKTNNGASIIFNTSRNGVFVNHHLVKNEKELKCGDLIELFGLKVIYFGEIIAISTNINKAEVTPDLPPYIPYLPIVDRLPKVTHENYYFNRSPRVIPSISTEKITIDPPTNQQFSKKPSLIMTIGPSFTMAIPMLLGCLLMLFSSMMSGISSGIFMMMGVVTALGSGIMGAIWAFLNVKNTRENEIEDEKQRFNAYGNYLIEVSDYIKQRYSQNTEALYQMYPSPSECCKYDGNSPELWSRNTVHDDFLFYRLGLGDIDFQVEIQIPTERFSVEFDSLKDKPAMLYENFKVLKNVPIGLNFAEHSIYGIAGGKNRAGVNDIVNNIICQIAATACYTDVKIVFCADKNRCNINKYDYIKWLPHVWSENKKFRFFATDEQEVSDVLFELAETIRLRAERDNNSFKKTSYCPHYFLFLYDYKMIEGELISKYIFDTNNNYGLTTFFLTDYYNNLPNICENIIQNDENFHGYYNALRRNASSTRINFDRVSISELNNFAREISNLKVKEKENDDAIPASLDFFEMYKVKSINEFNVIENWLKNKTYNSMKALIGIKTGNSECYLDIHEKYHGPHGLVAGTTGSGKSELIQTFILSLAINYSPDDVVFFIIDFKGGGMANLFTELPHMAGRISNLSGNQIYRAMISIKSENLRRQKLFGEFGVNNINNYTRLYKSGEATQPIPHLIIIIDEFAELKKEEPDFMQELISVAQVGRSLGVHLILATQKPAGTVDDNIWSNAKFRLCLRVQDQQDSNDMIHKPDAAYITQAGRCYMQVGNDEIFELFQSGWSGALYDNSVNASKDDIATMITNTGKAALIGNHTKIQLREKERLNWIKFLCDIYNENYDLDSNISENELAKKLMYVAKENGYNIGFSAADHAVMKGFVNLASRFDANAEQIIEESLNTGVKLPEIKEKTQLEALVEYISRQAKISGFTNKVNLWLQPLAEKYSLKDILNPSSIYDGVKWKKSDNFSLSAVVGLYDDPHNQSQLPFYIDFLNGGHIAVCGSVVSGKSTFLQTMIFSFAIKYSPEEINFYIIDFSNSLLKVFEELPHTGGVIDDTDLDSVEKFFNLMGSIIEQRKELLSGGNFSQYNRNNENKISAIVIVIDNYAGFKEKTDNEYENMIMNLSREGIRYGIFLAISAAGFSLAEIPGRIGDNMRTVVSLEMSDKFKYMDVLRTNHIELLPEQGIKGRGIGYVDGRLMEFQTAVAVDSSDDYKRNTDIKKVCEIMNKNWQGERAIKVPCIPNEPTYDDIKNNKQYIALAHNSNYIPYAYRFEDASVYSVNLSDVYCYFVSGKRRTGKTNVLKLLLNALDNLNCKKVIIEKSSNELKRYIKSDRCIKIIDDKGICDFFKEFTPEFIERNNQKKLLIEQGLSDRKIYEQMCSYEPVFVFIADMTEFIDSIYNPEYGVGNMSDFFENIFEKGYLHNIYFFAAINTDDDPELNTYKAYNEFIEYKTGVHLGGNLASQRVFNFQNINYNDLSKAFKKGEGLVPSDEDDTIAERIIIPLVRGEE